LTWLYSAEKGDCSIAKGRSKRRKHVLQRFLILQFQVQGVMERPYSLRRLTLIAGLTAGALLLLSGVARRERTPFWSWYSVHKLVRAPDGARRAWVERVAELDQAAVPQLIACLRSPDASTCGRALEGLAAMVRNWGPSDTRRAQLAGCLAERFATLSEPGRQVALRLQLYLVKTTQPSATPDLMPATTRMLVESTRTANTLVHQRALALVLGLMDLRANGELSGTCCRLIRACLGDQEVEVRLQALGLAMRPEIGLSDAAVPLLSDPAPEVRRRAMLAVGSAPAVVNTDDLLRWLHDTDPVVRELCEKALRSRGLGDEHVKLGRLLTDGSPSVRLQVLNQLYQANDLEPGVWLRHLSHDSAAAVRAAAVRAAAERAMSSLTDRLEQMAQSDPSPSVRQLAHYYLSSQRTGFADSMELER
jgi:hypothetical protein